MSSKTINQVDYSRGYLSAMQKIMNWVNSQDDMPIKEFRSKLYHFCLEARPEKY